MTYRPQPQKTPPPVIDRTVQHGDHEVIYPRNSLAAKVLRRADGSAVYDEEAVARADEALKEIALEFEGWLDTEIERLRLAHEHQKAAGEDPQAQIALFRQAHDLKSNAAVFGYPLIGEAAASMAQLLGAVPPQFCPAALVEQHVRAIRAIAANDIRGADNPLALELIRELREQSRPVIEQYQETASTADPYRKFL